jgi:hypothetical protein
MFYKAMWQWAFKSAVTEVSGSGPWHWQNNNYAHLTKITLALAASAALQSKAYQNILGTLHNVVFLNKYDSTDELYIRIIKI